MRTRIFCTLMCVTLLVVLSVPKSSLAAVSIEPTVSEAVDEGGNVEYTIHNPELSGVEVIALLVSNNTEGNLSRYVDNSFNWAWIAEPEAVTSSSWDTMLMGELPEAPCVAVMGTTTTWANFTGETFTTAFNVSDNVMGYFLDYVVDDESGNYNFTGLSNAVAEGENRSGFHVGANPMSDYLLVATDDTGDDIVDPANTFTYSGTATPEPMTMLMFIIGAALIRKH